MKPNVDAVVFDLDGTLINIGGFVEWNKAQEDIVRTYLEHGCDEENVEACSAKGLFTMLEEMYEVNAVAYGEVIAVEIQEAVYDILSGYEEAGNQRCTKMTGCVEALEWVKETGIPMGICTSNSQTSAEKTLRQEGLAHYFKAVVGRTTRHRMKPHPDQLLECYRILGVKPSRGAFVGDSHRDVIAGKAVGSYTIAVPMYFSRVDKMKEAGVDRIIDSLLELPAALLEI
ncbi:MAG TPA: HAD family hydrolase [Candidatus Krumholzibacteriaceae bacterium]|nr:HAD family hydrolase [Candidatus Krumholzibacteriaceae bacterium]